MLRALKTRLLSAILRAGYVVVQRDVYNQRELARRLSEDAWRQREVEREAAGAAERRRLEDACATERLRAEQLEVALEAERRRASRHEAAARELFDARLATARAEQELERAREELWLRRQAADGGEATERREHAAGHKQKTS